MKREREHIRLVFLIFDTCVDLCTRKRESKHVQSIVCSSKQLVIVFLIIEINLPVALIISSIVTNKFIAAGAKKREEGVIIIIIIISWSMHTYILEFEQPTDGHYSQITHRFNFLQAKEKKIFIKKRHEFEFASIRKRRWSMYSISRTTLDW